MVPHCRRWPAPFAIAGLLLLAGGCAGPAPLPLPTAAQPCPSWINFPADRNTNRDPQYLGCSNAMNLRSMVANPADLERGRPLEPADGERSARAVEVYRQGPTKAGASPSAAAAPNVAMPAVGGAASP
jgi:hypothetical protein